MFLVRENRRRGEREKANSGIIRNRHGSVELAKPSLLHGEAGIRKHGFRLARNRELFHASVWASGQGNFQITLLQARQFQHRLHEVGILIIKDIRPDGIVALNHSGLQRKRGGRNFRGAAKRESEGDGKGRENKTEPGRSRRRRSHMRGCVP